MPAATVAASWNTAGRACTSAVSARCASTARSWYSSASFSSPTTGQPLAPSRSLASATPCATACAAWPTLTPEPPEPISVAASAKPAPPPSRCSAMRCA